jgi:excinuclease ABC subunit C
LRKVFPFYTSNRHPKNKCTWCHLGLCPGPKLFENPPSPEASEGLREYKKNIKKLILILQGKRKTVLYSLKKEMNVLSQQKKFEEALAIREKISALEQVMAHTHVIEYQNLKIRGKNLHDEKWIETEKILQKMLKMKTPIYKIECYDISNIQGTQAVGSMIVFINGSPDKSQYKKFRIRIENKPNDIAMLKEVLTRRLLHPEWKYPEIILIDGGIAQLNIGIQAKNTLPAAKQIKIISIAKGKKELLIENQKKHVPLKTLPQEIYNLIVHLDDEAHRFAISYHKKLRREALLT